MAIRRYLAMTAAEIAENRKELPHIAWLACHFSSNAPGLANLPDWLPKDSLLTLTDQIPFRSQDTEPICRALTEVIAAFQCRGLLLDFQRPGMEDAFTLAKELAQALPCPVVVSELYAKGLTCPVFLSPVPLHQRLADHIAPWRGREVWLDISTEGERICLTEEGASFTPLPRFSGSETGHQDKNLHCHYSISLTESSAEFTLWRTREDLKDLISEAETCGIKTVVGLYQEMYEYLP